MHFQIERGKHLQANLLWVDFVVNNSDIITTLKKAPVVLERIDKGKYRGMAFGAKIQTEIIKNECTATKGSIMSLADIRLPGGIGRTYAKTRHLYYFISPEVTSMQININFETTGLMSLYVLLRKKGVYNYIDRICNDIENCANKLDSEYNSVAELLNESQIQRVEQFKKQLSKSSSAAINKPRLQASLTIALVNELMLVEADATLPDKHFLKARNEIPRQQQFYETIEKSALTLAAINNPAFAYRGSQKPETVDIEFRQAAFEFGHNLYKTYFSENLKEVMPVLLHYENNTFLKLDIDEQVEGLPWEALHDGKDFLSTKLCFSRVLGSQNQELSETEINFEKGGILLVGSDSRGDLPGTSAEVNNIAELLKSSGFKNVKLLHGHEATRQNILKELGSGDFNVLHFSGHSVFNSAYPYQSYLEFIRSEKLFLHELDDYASQGLDLVFLNSCQSGKTGFDKTTGRNLSMCRTIRESGVGNVIGMLWNVSDDAAAQFASVFYTYLASNSQDHVTEAMRQTRVKVSRDRAWQDGSWLAPILYT